MRADAQRNLLAVLEAAKATFAEMGTQAPVRNIARRAGVGVGTVYRHFPSRAELIAAVFAREIEACADCADRIAAIHPPFEALALWMNEFVELVSTKRGLGDALHSGDPAFDQMPERRDQRLLPAFRRLFEAARAAEQIRSDIDADDFLNTVTILCMSIDTHSERARRLVALLLDGLRYRTSD